MIRIGRIKDLMQVLEYSQAGLAHAVGCTQGTIQQILNGKTERSRYLPEIATALGTTVEYLMGTTDRLSHDDASQDGETQENALSRRTTPEEREVAVRLGREAERLARAVGLSARGASIKANRTPETVRQMKLGHMPDSMKLYRLAEVLGVSMHDMIGVAVAGETRPDLASAVDDGFPLEGQPRAVGTT